MKYPKRYISIRDKGEYVVRRRRLIRRRPAKLTEIHATWSGLHALAKAVDRALLKGESTVMLQDILGDKEKVVIKVRGR